MFNPSRLHSLSIQSSKISHVYFYRRFSTKASPLKVCVVGSGPAGFYATEQLLQRVSESQVDIYERLPVPFGLVRFGVSPDHPEVKVVSHKFEQLATDSRCRFIGNVTVGKDISFQELRSHYDAVILAYGAEGEHQLGIPGESTIRRVYPSRDFIAWLNGHPDYQSQEFNLQCREAAIVGQGNVAIDVARLLLKPRDELRGTDISSSALRKLEESSIERIHLVGRRGPAQAACTTAEVRELMNMKNCTTYFLDHEMKLNNASEEELKKERGKRRLVELFAKKGTHITDLSQIPFGQKAVVFHFLCNPSRVLSDGEEMKGLEVERTVLEGPPGAQTAVGTGESHVIPCGVLFRSIGYKSLPVEGIPFDAQRHRIPNEEGRVVEGKTPLYGVYACGWVRRGPSGIIGTNRWCAEVVMDTLLNDWEGGKFNHSSQRLGFDGITPLLQHRNIPTVSFAEWKKVDHWETERGLPLGKPREKFTSTSEILRLLQKK